MGAVFAGPLGTSSGNIAIAIAVRITGCRALCAAFATRRGRASDDQRARPIGATSLT
jgi:hypothetical protein